MPLFSTNIDADRSLSLHSRLSKATPDAWERILTEKIERIPVEADDGRIIYSAMTLYRVTVRYARGEAPLETEWMPSPEEAIASLEKNEPIN